MNDKSGLHNNVITFDVSITRVRIRRFKIDIKLLEILKYWWLPSTANFDSYEHEQLFSINAKENECDAPWNVMYKMCVCVCVDKQTKFGMFVLSRER